MSLLDRHLLSLCLAVVSPSVVAPPCPGGEPATDLPAVQFPRIEKYGSVVALPDAGERIRAGGKIYFDTTAAAPAGKPNRGARKCSPSRQPPCPRGAGGPTATACRDSSLQRDRGGAEG